jgi:hypothetical protein
MDGIKRALLAGTAVLALAFPVAAMAQGHDHGSGHPGGGMSHGGGAIHASNSHGGWHGGGGWHGHGGWHHGGWGVGYGYSPTWWGPEYSGWYDNDWNYPAYAPAAPNYASTWYYCQNPAGYYPYVAQCYGPWQQVPAG